MLKYSGSVPEHYDSDGGPYLLTPYAKQFVGRLASLELPPQPRVLELACGTGRLTAELCSHFPPEVHIVATDLSEAMLSVGRGRVSGNVEWRQADMQALPFSAESFDLVVAQFGLMLVPDRSKALSEAYRVLAPGGRLVFSVWSERSFLQQVSMDALTPFLSGMEATKLDHLRALPFSMADTAAVIEDLVAVGLSSVTHERLTLPVEQDEQVRHIARSMVFGTGCVGLIPEVQHEDAVRSVLEALIRSRPVLSEAILYSAQAGS